MLPLLLPAEEGEGLGFTEPLPSVVHYLGSSEGITASDSRTKAKLSLNLFSLTCSTGQLDFTQAGLHFWTSSAFNSSGEHPVLVAPDVI